MLSSQGNTSKTNNGVIVTQTVGQQSAIGNYTNNGFDISLQQANWARIILEETSPEFEVSLYPNPFEGIVSIQHNTEEDITINVFDPAGKLVFNNVLNVTGPNQSINLEHIFLYLEPALINSLIFKLIKNG